MVRKPIHLGDRGSTSCGTWYLQENPGQVRELTELMGHSDLSRVMKYALSDEKRARAGVARL